MEKVKVVILGREYILRTEGSEERLTMLAAQLESEIEAVRSVMRNRSEAEVVTVVALDKLDDAEREKEDKKKLLHQADGIVKQLDARNKEYEALRTAAESTVNTVEALQSENKELKEAIAKVQNAYTESRHNEEENLKKYDRALKRIAAESEKKISELAERNSSEELEQYMALTEKYKAEAETQKKIALEKQAEIVQMTMDCEASINALNDGLAREKSENEKLRQQLKHAKWNSDSVEEIEKMKSELTNAKASVEELEKAKSELAGAKASAEELEKAKSELAAARAEIEELRKVGKSNEDMLNEGIHSAQAEMEQLANVKDDENKQLRAKIMEYEQTFERMVEEKDKEIKRLKDTFEGVSGEMSEIADAREEENEELKTSLESTESQLDQVLRMKEIEIKALLESNNKLRRENESYISRIDALSNADDGQITLC